eukprot:TRINITY_DN63135_c0_g1_i1.p1 TRINITY_DN63135_c0_g1~~TRINITY_DN63135_c0_g1_i1.p1  ORF type:complete len:433 (-),score=59.35 TRINITY_DN63135_c0_g1_i1:141-1439(-)
MASIEGERSSAALDADRRARRWARGKAKGSEAVRCEDRGLRARDGETCNDEDERPANGQSGPPPPAALIHRERARESKARGKGRKPSSGSLGSGLGAGKGASLAAGHFAAGVQTAFMQKYAADIKRLEARADLPPTVRWIDSHCHLESIMQRTWRGGGKPQVTQEEPDLNLPDLIAQWPAGVESCISNFAFRRPSKPGSLPEWGWLQKNLHYFEEGSPISSKLWFTIGIHPHDVGNWDDAAEQMVRKLAPHPKCVGIGECGLDFFRHGADVAAQQVAAFRAQAKLAVELGKALVVHARLESAQNEELFMSNFKEIVPAEHPVHLHCYSDSLRLALELCSGWKNLRVGFTGGITFGDRSPKGVAQEQLVKGIPLERLLIETDGPYMCPAPFRGQTAHPGHVHRVAERIAEWHGKPLAEVMIATRKSTAVVYGI